MNRISSSTFINIIRQRSEVERIRLLRPLHELFLRGQLCSDSARKEALTERFATKRRIAACAEDGKVAIVESGRDCDGVEYSGKVSIIPSTLEAYCAACDQIAEGADGPFWLDVERPSIARTLRYESRDLVAEAFENGHPHVLIPGNHY